jgi:hypothetical protein
MWRNKKFIIIALVAIVVLAGSIGGIALAQTGDEGENQTEAIFDKVTAVLVEDGVNITSEQLKDAFAEVQRDMRNQAVEKFLDKLVEEDKITQSEADDYLQWWSERPEILNGFGLRERFGFGGMRFMPRIRGFGGFCLPAEPEE